MFHVINRGAKKSRLFESDQDYAAFERILAAAVKRFDIALFAYCLMPNHWHLLLSPRTDGELSRFMHWLTTTHARRWHMAHGTDGQGAVYQGRFRAIAVGTDHEFLWVCRYVERNPVRACLIARAEHWRWCSLWKRNRGDASVSLSAWPMTEPANWIDHVNQPQTTAELEAFRSALAKGTPFGLTDPVRTPDPLTDT